MISSQDTARDFSQPFTFDLQQQTPNKTVDIGRNGVSLSLDAQGRILQASIFHPEHGIIVAVPFGQFDGSKFYEPEYVRSYRTQLLRFIQDNRPGFGLIFDNHAPDVSMQLPSANTAAYKFTIRECFEIALTVQVAQSGNIIQVAKITNIDPAPATLPYSLSLGVSLNRASYGQLTEGGPLPLPQSHNILRQDGQNIFIIANPNLTAQLAGRLQVDGTSVNLSNLADQNVRDAPLNAEVPGSLNLQPGATAEIRAQFQLSPDLENHPLSHTPLQDIILNYGSMSAWKQDDALTTYILRRNVDYILANCTIPVAETVAAIITDHVALPLGWNRDNYWQIRLLLKTYKNLDILIDSGSRAEYAEQIRFAVKGHLNWVFTQAQRPHGYWHRSYLINGKPKDHAIFQLDQQCYPLLEISDYLEYFPEEIDFVAGLATNGVVQDILNLLESKRDPETGLWPTDETPGDDAVIYPYHFSSHILLWRTMTRLRDLLARIQSATSSEVQRLDALSHALRESTLRTFPAAHPDSGKLIYAYLTDGRGAAQFYHDGNDVPTLFAQQWGFLQTPSEVSTWQNTMEFAFSPSNSSGYCSDGPYSGLGSVHSPGPWVLGYFQEFAYKYMENDREGMLQVWHKIAAAMQWDGTFSEAVDPNTAACTSKAWFSWPGSMIGALLIQMRREGHEEVLLQANDNYRTSL